MWKAGCLTALLGIVLSVGSFFFFGNAIKKAATSREVTSARMEPGRWTEMGDVRVDSDAFVQIQMATKIQLSDENFTADSTGSIQSLRADVAYEVQDEYGDLVYQESGRTSGSMIVPGFDSPHRASFDREDEFRFEGKRFEPPESGILRVRAQIAERDEEGNPVIGGRLTVHDQIADDASSWAWGGVLSMLLGPFVVFVGFIVFVIGLFRTGSKKSSTIPPVPRS